MLTFLFIAALIVGAVLLAACVTAAVVVVVQDWIASREFERNDYAVTMAALRRDLDRPTGQLAAAA